MANYNKVILLGNLTRDPQLSYLPSQTPVVEIGLAVNHRWRGQDGQMQEKTCFIDCRAYGRQAETLNQYMRKGRQLMIEGRLELDQWEAQDGSKRSKHRVFIERFTFVDNQGGGQGGSGGGGRQQQQPQQNSQASRGPAPGGPQPDYYDNQGPAGDDIPF